MRSARLAVSIIIVVVVLVLAGSTSPGPDSPASPRPDPPASSDDPTWQGRRQSPSRPSFIEFVHRVDGSTSTIPLVRVAARSLAVADEAVRHSTVAQAYANLADGAKDIIFTPKPNAEVAEAVAKAGVVLETVPIAKDALVFLANRANCVDGLTSRQIRDIYSGSLTNWSALGCGPAAIVPFQHEVDSGSQGLFLDLVMGATPLTDPPSDWTLYAGPDLVREIASYDNRKAGLGYSVFYNAQQIQVENEVKLLEVDSVAPSVESIADESYPFWTTYYAVIRADQPADSWPRKLINWLISDEGQQTLSKAGYVPLDGSNMVAMPVNYGFFGSTPVNTTESRGSGGKAGRQAPDLPTPCSFPCSSLFTSKGSALIPDYPEAEKAVNAWMDGLAPGYSSSADVVRDLLIVFVHWDEDPTADRSHWVMFRLSDGRRMKLSDLFYDGVNYIEFINANLVDTIHQEPGSGLVPLAPFTGLPDTYELFSLCQGCLLFRFPDDNPFLKARLGAGLSLRLRLPKDLSPYGDYWRVEATKVGDTMVDHVSRDYAGVNPVDKVLNQSLDALARQHPGASAVKFDSLDQGVVQARVFDHNGSRVLLRQRLWAFFDWASGSRVQIVTVKVGQIAVDHLISGRPKIDAILNKNIDAFARENPKVATIKFDWISHREITMEAQTSERRWEGNARFDYATGRRLPE